MLGGCAAQQCDPHTADFFSGVGCAAGGGYNQRIGTLQNTLQQTQNYDVAMRQQQAEQMAAGDAAIRTATILEGQIHEMQREQAELRAKLQQIAERRGNDEATRNAARQLDQLQKRTQAEAKSPPDQATVQQLQDDQRKLVEALAHL
jgi:glutamate-1-semialdehyde aminotransferase